METFSTFSKKMQGRALMSDQLVFCHLTDESDLMPFDFGADSVLNMLVVDGEAVVICDDMTVRVGKCILFDAVNRYHCRIKSVSPKFSAKCFIFKTGFITTLLNGRPIIPIEYVENRMVDPCFHLSTLSLKRINHSFEEVEGILGNPQNRFLNHMLASATSMYMMVLSDCYQNEKGIAMLSANLRGNSRKLFLDFVALLPEYVSTEHSVAFYASKLCVTPQYLNRVVKQGSGDNVMKWIGKFLANFIAVALEKTDDNLQQLADRFNFQDVASFTRYFKRITGLTPTEFRNRLDTD